VELPEMIEEVEIKIPMLIPYELFHAACNHGAEIFNHCCLGDSGIEGVLYFWKEALTEKWATKHPIIAKHTPEDMFPMVWHLDGGEIHVNSEYYQLQVGTILAQFAGVDSMDGRFLVCRLAIEPSMLGGIHVESGHLVMLVFGVRVLW